MKLLNFTAQPNGLRLETSRGLIDLTAYSADIIRIRYTLEPEFSPKKSLMVVSEAPEPGRSFRSGNKRGALFFDLQTIHPDQPQYAGIHVPGCKVANF